MRILAINDSPTELYCFRRALLKAHPAWALDETATSDEAMVWLKGRRYDLIIEDIIRPGCMDGLQFLMWLYRSRSAPKPPPPVIVASLMDSERYQDLIERLERPEIRVAASGAPWETLIPMIEEMVGA